MQELNPAMQELNSMWILCKPDTQRTQCLNALGNNASLYPLPINDTIDDPLPNTLDHPLPIIISLLIILYLRFHDRPCSFGVTLSGYCLPNDCATPDLPSSIPLT